MYLHEYFQDELQEILEGHDREQQRNHGEKTRQHEMEQCEEVDGKRLHLLDHGITVAEVSEGLDVGGAKQWFVIGVVVADPLLVKQTGICGSERSVLLEPDVLRPGQPFGKDNERNSDDENGEDDIGHDRCREVLERNFVVDDIVGDRADNPDGQREENDTEESLRLTDEAEATGLVRMRGEDLEIEVIDAVGELEPEKEPPEPAVDEELKERGAEADQPNASPCDRGACTGASDIPGGGVDRRLLEPNDRKRVSEDRQESLGKDGVARFQAAIGDVGKLFVVLR